MTATNEPVVGTTNDAARGTHTITIVASDDGDDGPKGVNEATVEIQVGGAPATITRATLPSGSTRPPSSR